jgi:hypothetical protein
MDIHFSFRVLLSQLAFLFRVHEGKPILPWAFFFQVCRSPVLSSSTAEDEIRSWTFPAFAVDPEGVDSLNELLEILNRG